MVNKKVKAHRNSNTKKTLQETMKEQNKVYFPADIIIRDENGNETVAHRAGYIEIDLDLLGMFSNYD